MKLPSASSLKNYITPDAIPLFTAITFGVLYAGYRMVQMTQDTDASIFRKNSIYDWQERLKQLDRNNKDASGKNQSLPSTVKVTVPAAETEKKHH